MLVEVPDDIVERAEVNSIDLCILLAVQLYTDNRIDYADACRLAHLPAVEMNRELLERNITIQQYPPGSTERREVG